MPWATTSDGRAPYAALEWSMCWARLWRGIPGYRKIASRGGLQGTIKEFQWTNPHTFIYIDVPNAAGGVDSYGIEGMSPNYLAREGWDTHTLSTGDQVELVIHPLKDGRKGGFDVSVKKPGGTLMYNLPHSGY